MFASLTNARFAVPENPVQRGFGRLGYAMGQPVILTDNPSATIGDMSIPGGLAPGQNGAVGMQYNIGPNGQLQYNQMGPADSQYTADFCNKIINGGGASSADQFQCSIRGYVGANGIYPPGTYVPPAKIPPALVPDPPTSVTIPRAAMVVSQMPPSYSSNPTNRCGAFSAPGADLMNNCWLAVGAGIAAYLLLGGNRG